MRFLTLGLAALLGTAGMSAILAQTVDYARSVMASGAAPDACRIAWIHRLGAQKECASG